MALRRPTVDPASRIEHLIRYQHAQFRQTFFRAVQLIRNERTLASLARLLEQGRLEEALRVVDAAGRLLGDQYGRSLSESARATEGFLNRALTIDVSFDQTNWRAVERIQRSRLRLIEQFTAEQRMVTRNAISDGIRRGLNPREQARAFRSSIGLTDRQRLAVDRFRTMLESTSTDPALARQFRTRTLRDARSDRRILRAIRDREVLTPQYIDKMVGRYETRFIAKRARDIARTESMRSVHEGSREMYQQAIEQGALHPEELIRGWVAAHDDRVRESHADMHGQERGIEEPFESGDGNELLYPGDPDAPPEETVNCRCALTTRMVPRESNDPLE
jgi:hypothetical protein